MLIGRENGAVPWLRLKTLPTPTIVLEAPAISLGNGATLGVARQTDPVAADAAWIAWFTAVGAFTGIPAPVVTPLGSIALGSLVVKSK